MAVLVDDKSVRRTLFAMAFPMLAGTFALNAYNLTDTWFVAQLGTLPLAAMGFIFPVVMLIGCIVRGIGTGVTTLVSHAVGRYDHEDAALLVTHGLIFTFIITAALSVIGYVCISPIFRRLGADGDTLPLIAAYMRIWYIGAPFMSLPMIGNGILVSVGDSKAASRLMMLGMILNIVLDPIMIFGFFSFPAMGIEGAALATVIARIVGTVWLFFLLRKHHLLSLNLRRSSAYFISARRINTFAAPSILSLILMPISASVITKILSGFGHEAVAAGGAANRIEMFAFVIPMALGMSLTPFVSQNFGANRIDRVSQAHAVATSFALYYGAAVAVVFFIAAPLLGKLFSEDPKVVHILVSYIRIISFGYGMMEVHRYGGFFLTGLHKPKSATLLNIIRVIALLIPLSYLGASAYGITGVFAGRLLADILSGGIAIVFVLRFGLKRAFQKSAVMSETESL